MEHFYYAVYTEYLQSIYRVFTQYLQLEHSSFRLEDDSGYEPANKLHNSHDEFLQNIFLLETRAAGGVQYLKCLGHDHLPGFPVCRVGGQDQGDASQEDEDGGQDGVGHHGWLVVSGVQSAPGRLLRLWDQSGSSFILSSCQK